MAIGSVRALVTGGTGAIGAAICRLLARRGHHVYVHAHQRLEQAESLAEQVRAAGGSAEAIAFDVRQSAAAHAALERLLQDGPVQILVNNAGVHDDAVLPGMTATQWHRVIDVCLHGFFHVTQPLIMPMIRTRWGRIVNISSVAALIGNRGQANYAAAKGALIAASRALALELANRSITVNAVAPGIIETQVTTRLFDDAAIARLVPMGRAGTAEEVAAVVDFLVAESSGYITGQVLCPSGGMAMV